MQLLDGKKLSADIRAELKQEVQRQHLAPGLAIILVGNDPASELYIKQKQAAADEIGVTVQVHRFAADSTPQELMNIIAGLNENPEIHGIIVQLPLPTGLDPDPVIAAIDPRKDVDGFHPENIKALMHGTPTVIPPVHAGILKFLEATAIFHEKHPTAHIMSKSEIFVTPLKALLHDRGVIIISEPADILITALGQPFSVGKESVKSGSIVIDVGTTLVNGKVTGDVNFDEVATTAGWITPVPGGVGPMTVAMLMRNVVARASRAPQDKSRLV